MTTTGASGRDARKAPARNIAWNRTLHRIGAFIAALLMLWMGTTGSWMQLIDFKTILSDAPPSDPTQLSIMEGMYGPGNYTVIQVPDFTASALPADLDLNQAMGVVLKASDAAPPPAADDSGHSAAITWVELRLIDGKPAGQVMKGSQLQAFDAVTGDAVTAAPPQQLPQGGRLPPSLRQKLKTLHRFWNRGDTPGVYFEFLTGLVLWALLITGLIMYFQLLKARAKAGRKQWFWFTGSAWRSLHRSVSVLAAVFLLCIAFSGTWIGYESSWSALGRRPPPVGGPPRRAGVPLSDDEVHAMTATTLQAMQQLHPGMPIKAIRLRTFGKMKQGVVVSGGAQTDQLVFDAATGRPVSLTEPAYPKSNFPFGVQVHENMKHFHSGAMFGLSTRAMNLFAGLSLIFLSASGLYMYFDMWLKRRKGGRNNLFWQ